MAVAVDATGTALISGTGTGTTTASYTGITVGASANALIFVIAIGTQNATSTAPSARWDSAGTNQAMTLIGSQSLTNAGGNHLVCAFGLRNPTTGAGKTLTATWTGANCHSSNAISFTGVDTTSDVIAFKNFQSATTAAAATTTAVTVTSAVGDMVLGAYATGNLTSFLPATAVWESDVTTTNGPDTKFIRNNGASSITMTGTPGASTQQVVIGFDIAASAGVDVLASQIWL